MRPCCLLAFLHFVPQILLHFLVYYPQKSFIHRTGILNISSLIQSVQMFAEMCVESTADQNDEQNIFTVHVNLNLKLWGQMDIRIGTIF